MRVVHLTDEEIQLYLDRWRPSSKVCRQNLNQEDLEALQHLDHCARCQGELQLYRELFRDLNEPAETSLPRSFARRVTWSLPPFAAMRTRARIKAALSSGSIALLVVAWLLSRVDWVLLAARCFTFVDAQIASVRTWLWAASKLLPMPNLSFPNLSARWLEFQQAFERILTFEYSQAHLAVLGCLAAALVLMMDRLVARIYHRHDL